MTFIVTGGAGFIGSCIVARLNELGYQDIIVVDHVKEHDQKQKNLEGKSYRKFYDKQAFLDLILNDDVPALDVACMIHMGACSSTTLTDEAYYKKNNYEYSCHMAQWAMNKGVRLIYASSAATYGDGHLGYSDQNEVSRKLQPLNLYGWSKQNFDMWILDQGWDTRVVGLKFFNVFGPNEYHKGDMRSVIVKSYQKVVGEGTMRLFKSYHPDYADGEQKRDFIYVKDAIDVVLFFVDHPEINGIFNVGTGLAQSWNDVAQALFKGVGLDPVIEYYDMPDTLKDKYQYFTQADMSKLRSVGYQKPFMPLEDSVADYVSYLKNQSYY